MDIVISVENGDLNERQDCKEDAFSVRGIFF